MKTFAFPRKARLKSQKAIDNLFGRVPHGMPSARISSCLCYPLRAVWTEPYQRTDSYNGTRILISVPKKRLRHAVQRVTMRRRVREAWRLQRHQGGDINLDIAFIYVANKVENYSKVSNAISKIIGKLHNN